ncbi:MAG: GntR family transcriptional regulator [Lachnospiraceae bacterium]|nr:GntR family transcriptional regulator [Lachnospiraceae bacterium]
MKKNGDSQVTGAYEYIRDRIVTYALLPGERLSDYKIAQALSMSRAPVREAILLLERDGLVALDEKGKKAVAQITLFDVTDILHVRGALESEALSILSEKGWLKEEEEKKLKDIHRRMLAAAKNGEVRDCYAYDDAFHHAFVSFAESPRIIETLERMRLQMQRARFLNATNPVRQEETCKEHEEIIRAILKKDLRGATRALRTHFSNSESAFRKALNNQETLTMASMIRSLTAGQVQGPGKR